MDTMLFELQVLIKHSTQARISFNLQEQGNTNNSSFTGFVNDAEVYSVIGSNISFHDRDASYSISAGDYFVINSREIGVDQGDWTFVMLDQGINYVLGTC